MEGGRWASQYLLDVLGLSLRPEPARRGEATTKGGEEGEQRKRETITSPSSSSSDGVVRVLEDKEVSILIREDGDLIVLSCHAVVVVLR